MRILGIDPGTATTGYGILDLETTGEFKLLEYGLVSTSKDLPHGVRLDLIYTGISSIIEKHNPEVVSIERLFFATNALTAISVGQAIGVIKLAIHRHNLPVFDYTPMQVKLYVGGSGKADKKQMKSQVKKIFKIREKKGHKSHFDDSADAIALALCHIKKSSLNPLLEKPHTKSKIK